MSRANISGWTHDALFPTFAVTELPPFATVRDQGDANLETYEISGVIDRTILEVYLNEGAEAGTMIFFPTRRLDTIIVETEGLGKRVRVDWEARALKSGWDAASAGHGQSVEGEIEGTQGAAWAELK